MRSGGYIIEHSPANQDLIDSGVSGQQVFFEETWALDRLRRRQA
jgi:hypothetical protein